MPIDIRSGIGVFINQQCIMDSHLLLAHIRQFIELTGDETSFLEGLLIARPFRQGEIIVKGGDAARYLAYVNAGYTVTYYTDHEGNDHVVRFAASGWWSGDVYSLGKEPHTPLTTKGLCDGELLLLPRPAQDQLFERCPKFERYFRYLFQTALMRQQMRFVEGHSVPARQRYLNFRDTFPGIEQYLPQKYVASFLGITPEFLSKVRKDLVHSKS
jgi:CRP-like cAMP-binding protein